MAEPSARNLWLIRHAQATHPTLGQTDLERGLTPRGLSDVQALTKQLAEARLPAPQWLWVSSATRTRQTALPLVELWQSESIVEAALYLADAYTLLACLQTTPDEYTNIAIVGHNPGISELAHLLTRDDASRSLPRDLPTLSAVRLEVRLQWHALTRGNCHLIDCMF